ncbi:MAG TPA: sulfotransferase [Steroidobacteraceae bacterium]|nr:sulfotransferase [Steroidobacteraceae bacterium]
MTKLHTGALAEVEQRCRALLEARPHDGMVWKVLSVALLRQGKDALPALQRAVELLPDDAETHLNLGIALATAGARAEAVASYRQALALNPASMEGLSHLGDVLRELGEGEEALAVRRRAIELEPQRAEHHNNLGSILFDLRRLDEAAAAFRAALALHPDNARALLGLAGTTRMRGRAAEAEEICRAALALEPNNVEGLSLLGELYADRGQFEEGRALLERALAINPALPSVYSSLVGSRRMTDADGLWHQQVAALLSRPLPHGHEVDLRYALGKYFDDLGRYDEAFDSYRRANELARRHKAQYNRGRLEQRVERIIDTFDAEFLGARCAAGSPSELPVLIIGMPRSGTSLAEQILASHPAVFGGGELRFWEGAFGIFEAERAAGVSAAEILAQFAQDYLERVQALSGTAARVIDKMPANFLYAGLVHAALPRARIIHMQRHPLDTCLSIYSQNFFRMGSYSNDLEDLAHYYSQYLRIMRHWRTVLPAAAMLEIPYEALIADQESWTRRMLEFVGLPWDPRCLDFQNTERIVITASRWQVRQKINSASAGRWRNYAKHLRPLAHLVNLT